MPIVRSGPVADVRASSARAGGVPVAAVEARRVVRPAVELSAVEVDMPAARAAGVPDGVAESVRSRRDVDVAPVDAPSSRAGRVPFVEAPFRRRVRLGIDS